MLPFLFLSKRSVQSLQVNLPARFVFSLLSLTFRSGNLRADSTSHGIGTCTKSTKCIPWISATPSEVSSGSHAESMWWRHHARFGVRESTGSGMTSLGAFESLSCSESYQLGKDFYLFFFCVLTEVRKEDLLRRQKRLQELGETCTPEEPTDAAKLMMSEVALHAEGDLIPFLAGQEALRKRWEEVTGNCGKLWESHFKISQWHGGAWQQIKFCTTSCGKDASKGCGIQKTEKT